MSEYKYRNDEKLPYPFCPGCSHSLVLDKLDEALRRHQIEPHKVVVVTDIGCIGLSDQWFTTHSFHGLHGRSVTYGEGIKLASPDLKVIVILGDGGAGIGGHHLINAAKRNIGISVILCNNFNFGMTGGEHSVTTPENSITVTTTQGHFEEPLRLTETVKINGGHFVARRAFYDSDLVDIMAQAIEFDGFSFVEILEFCTAYFVPQNKLKKGDMEALLTSGKYPRMFDVEPNFEEYTKKYSKLQESSKAAKKDDGNVITPKFLSVIKDKLDLIIAGGAGQKIRSLGNLLCRTAILSGLYAMQSDDYPVTIQTGFSVAFLKLDRQRPKYFGINVPDALFIISIEGYQKSERYFSKMSKEQEIYILSDLPKPKTDATIITVDINKLSVRVQKEYIGTALLAAYLKGKKIFPLEALQEAIKSTQKSEIAEKNLSIIEQADSAIFS